LDNPLIHNFGYNNLCIYFDYEPARTVLAMAWPICEIPIILYCILNWAQVYFSRDRCHISKKEFYLISIITPIEIICLLWFRLVFIHAAVESISKHTIGFTLLQLCLVLISGQNYFFYWLKRENKLQEKSLKNIFAIIYVISLIIITIMKMAYSWSILLGSAILNPKEYGYIGHFIDMSWFLLACLLPIILSYYYSFIRLSPFLIEFALRPNMDLE
jgi:amino acid transporter